MRRAAKRALFGAWRFVAGLARPSRRANLRALRARGETVDALVIRSATVDDVPALARLHVQTWNATYAPMLAKGPSVAVRERQWRAWFAEADASRFCFVVARPDGALVGFARGYPGDHPRYAGELRTIHLLAPYQRLGFGSRLVGLAASRFVEQGIHSMWLSGDPRNPSRGAWLALGAHELDDPGSGNFGWHDIRPLARLRG